MTEVRPFKLSPSFLQEYEGRQPNFGFNGLGYVVYKRTYARQKEDGSTEEFWETCRRVVEGCYNIQKKHCYGLGLEWDNQKAQRSAQEMFRRMWEMKWLPPGRGLWMMGTDYVNRTSASLNNCGMVSTRDLNLDLAEPFCWLMDMLMLGVGVGFDTKGAGTVKIYEPKQGQDTFVVEDNREGWVSLLRRVLVSYSGRGSLPADVDYSLVRPAGEPIRGFGGVASGPEPLAELIDNVKEVLNPLINNYITSEAIVDICNLIGRCVVAGNVRRSAELSLGESNDDTFLSLKNPNKNKEALYHHRWACVTGDTLVDTSKGLVRIDSVLDEQNLRANVGGVSYPVLGVKKTGTKPVYRLSTKGGQSIKVTANHQFLIKIGRGKSEWRRLDCLKVGDKILSPISDVCHITDFNSNDYSNGYLVGALIGDGTFVSTSTTGADIARLQVYGKDEGHQSLMSYMIKALDKFTSRSDYSGFSGPYFTGSSWWFASKKSFTEYVASKGVKRGNKCITPELLEESKDFQAGLVAGLFDADGWFVRDRKTFAIEQINKSDINRLQLILSRLGIMSRVNKCREEGTRVFPGNHERSTSACYRLIVSGYGMAQRFMSVCSPKHFEKVKSFYEVAAPERVVREYTFEVTSIEKVGTEDVYDMCVPAVKSFSANGLHVHNSNNSVLANVGMDYSKTASLTSVNGEPGYLWLDNVRAYGRMIDPPDYRDRDAVGTNPCFVGSTRVAVADGRDAVPLKQLADEGKDVPVYSMNPETGKVSIKWGRNPRCTRKNSELMRVYFSGSKYIDCTPDHKWILKDGTWKYTKDLCKGDSLSKFVKRQEPVKKGGNKYWRVYSEGPENTSGRIFEHRMIADFFDPETRDKLYDENKQNGWIKGGLVVHHKNYNPLDNRPENLEWMTFKDHTKFHAERDNTGENNGMYGCRHTEETKSKIGDKTLERTKDPEFRKKLSESHSMEEREFLSKRFKSQREEWNKKYWLEQESNTDLNTVWFGNKMFVRKQCEQCEVEFVVSWAKRDRSYCSKNCFVDWAAHLEKRKNNQKQYFYDRQKETRHNQIMVFKDLEEQFGRTPLKKEWEKECSIRGISKRFKSTTWGTDNPYVFQGFKELKEVAKDYNDRVKKVEWLDNKEDVYCLTVDDNHTMSVLLEGQEVGKSLKSLNVYQCSEQSLENMELCNLVETFPAYHDSYEDYEITLKYAYLYAKTVTLIPTHNQRTNQVVMKNRRIGASMSGISQAMKKHGRREFFNWCDKGYKYIKQLDIKYSDWLCIRESIKVTSVKPSGSVSLLAGATPGIHFPQSRYYLRRVRLQENHSLVKKLEDHGYPVEEDKYSPKTVVASFPIEEEYFERSKDAVTMWEQLELAAQMQAYWADNQVSVTVTFTPEESKDIQRALELYESRLKSVSFLPVQDHSYEQAPYESISKKDYEELMDSITPFTEGIDVEGDLVDRFCDGDVCEVK